MSANGQRRKLLSGHDLFKTEMCSAGSTGPFCGVCKDSYYEAPGGEGCVRCEGQLAKTLGAAIGILVGVSLVAAWSRWRIKQSMAGTMPPLAPWCYALFLRAYYAFYDTGRFKIVWCVRAVSKQDCSRRRARERGI